VCLNCVCVCGMVEEIHYYFMSEDTKEESVDFFAEQENDNPDATVKDFFIELLKVVIVALAIIIPVRYYFIKPFYVKGASMEPTFFDHEYLVVDEISYRFKDPVRGEVVVFRYPKDPKQFFIKRIIGLPGETIQITDGEVYINGELIEEPYLDEDTLTKQERLVTLQPDELYVLGDNREFSLDSRIFGPLPQEFIVGRTWIRGWPFNKIGTITPPEYDVEGSQL